MKNETPLEYFDRMMKNARVAMCDYGIDDKSRFFLLESIAHSLAVIADSYEKILGDPKDNEEYIE